MTDGPVAKRAKSDPDLKVVTDDGEMMVHSLILTLASPVFEKMLSSSMQVEAVEVVDVAEVVEVVEVVELLEVVEVIEVVEVRRSST